MYLGPVILSFLSAVLISIDELARVADSLHEGTVQEVLLLFGLEGRVERVWDICIC